ncbi:MAG TPA: trehalose-phosphatase [Microvirga sp.]|jgi:trehalose 6-phosphate phosphatase|nr:trehalose-phosphatase [Microvirga sp.]
MADGTGLQVEGHQWSLFLDFDGTLVEIVERPDAVVVEPALPGLLTRLNDRLGGALALVSGRPIAFLDERLAPARLDAAGLHGIERRLSGTLHPCRPEDHPALQREIADLKRGVEADPRLIVEDKGCSVALHWRLAPDRAAFAEGLARSIAERLGPAYRIQFGKAVAEILPAASGKGRVIEAFLEAEPYRGRRPLFIGDDLTDEHGFEVVNARGGVSVRVGGGDTIAGARLATPAAVREALRAWASGEPMPLEAA